MPDKLIICGMEYKIIEVDQICKDKLIDGEIDFINGVIKIDSTMTHDRKIITLIHEVLHGICDALGYKDLGEDESTIQGLASTLYSTFKESNIFQTNKKEE